MATPLASRTGSTVLNPRLHYGCFVVNHLPHFSVNHDVLNGQIATVEAARDHVDKYLGGAVLSRPTGDGAGGLG